MLPLGLTCAVAQVVRLSRQVPGFLEQLQAAAAAYERQRSLTRQALEDLNLPGLSWQHRPDLQQVCCSAAAHQDCMQDESGCVGASASLDEGQEWSATSCT